MSSAPTARLSLAMYHPRYWPLWAGLGLLWLLVQLPYPWQMALGRKLGRLSMLLLKRRVQIARRNLQLAMPELDDAARERLLVANFESVGCAVFETGMPGIGPISGCAASCTSRAMNMCGKPSPEAKACCCSLAIS